MLISIRRGSLAIVSELMQQIIEAGGAGLVDADLIDAENLAAENLIAKIGNRPTLEQFLKSDDNHYSDDFVSNMLKVVYVLLFAFILPSALRLFSLGRSHALTQYPDLLATLIGLSNVLGSELGAVGFMVASRTLAQDNNTVKRLLRAGAIVSILFAYIGNYEANIGATQFDYINVLGLIGLPSISLYLLMDTFAFPTLTLLTALFLELIILSNIEQRHKSQHEMKIAQSNYDNLISNPEEHHLWNRYFNQALWEVFREKNWRGRDKDRDARRMLISRANGRDKSSVVIQSLNQFEWAVNINNAPLADNSNGIERPLNALPAPNKGLTKREIVFNLFNNEPDSINWAQSAIAHYTGVSVGTVNSALKSYLSQHSPEAD